MRDLMSSVTFRGKTFLPENILYVWKINRLPEFYMTFARKILFSRFCFFFGGGGAMSPSPTPKHDLKWRTKSHGWKTQDLENDGPNLRARNGRTNHFKSFASLHAFIHFPALRFGPSLGPTSPAFSLTPKGMSKNYIAIATLQACCFFTIIKYTK